MENMTIRPMLHDNGNSGLYIEESGKEITKELPIPELNYKHLCLVHEDLQFFMIQHGLVKPTEHKDIVEILDKVLLEALLRLKH